MEALNYSVIQEIKKRKPYSFNVENDNLIVVIPGVECNLKFKIYMPEPW